MMKRYTLIVAAFVGLCLFSWTARSQQVPMYSHYGFNPFLYNPAYTGHDDKINLFLTHRAQWTGIPGSPNTSVFTADGQLVKETVGLGVAFFSDATDITRRVGGYSDYSYQFKIEDEHIIRLGLALGFVNNKVDFSKAVVKDSEDPALFNNNQTRTAIDANFGVLYLWPEYNVEAGIAVPQLFGNSFHYSNPDDTRTFYRLSRHYLFSAKYRYDIDDDWAVSPLVMLRFVPGAPFQYDVNAVGIYQDWAWLGVSYKSGYAVGVNGRALVHDAFSVGMAYEFIVGKLRGYGGHSAEFMLGYKFNVKGGAGRSNTLRSKYE